MKRIYMDCAATTPTNPRVLEAMMPYFTESFGNPSGIYDEARKAKAAVTRAREQIAAAIGCEADEIFFTSGGSESDNWALRGIMEKSAKKHAVVSAIEHQAVLKTCHYLEDQGLSVDYVKPDGDGRLTTDALKAALTSETAMVSIMTANNEIGVVEPIAELAACAKAVCPDLVFHTDAVQAFGQIPLDVKALGVDMMSLSGHKIYGPKGIGALYINKKVNLPPLIHGGEQENAHRAGTENVPAIVGFGAAAEMAAEHALDNNRVREMRDCLIDLITDSDIKAVLNGSRDNRLPGNISFTFPGVPANLMLMRLDMAGIAASAGSACTANDTKPSHVLTAIGKSPDDAVSTVRFSLGRMTTPEDVRYTAETVVEIVKSFQL